MGKSEFIVQMYRLTIGAGAIIGLLMLLSGTLEKDFGTDFWSLASRFTPIAAICGVLVVALKGLNGGNKKQDLNNHDSNSVGYGRSEPAASNNKVAGGYSNGLSEDTSENMTPTKHAGATNDAEEAPLAQ